MAPSFATLIPRRFDPSKTAGEFRDQWGQLNDVFNVLLILGGDVIARALAQVAGSGMSTVAFSFGWVAYAISALVSAVGENKLLALDPDCKCKVINGKSGYAKENSSWILGRIVRDFDHWRHPDIESKRNDVLDERLIQLRAKDSGAKRPPMAGLIVSVYQPSRTVNAGAAVKRDLVYWIGIPVILLQLGIAAIPCALFDDWGILLITTSGTILALATGLLPQWKKEKWACRHKVDQSYVLTRGNGAQHAIVVLGNGHGLNLEDLASGQSNVLVRANMPTRVALLVLAALWIVLLITAAGVEANTWFLFAVGGVGILQNIYIAGAQRRPENFGVPLEYVQVFGETNVMQTLFKVEEQYENIGRSLLNEFFPGELRQAEKDRWEDLKKAWQEKRDAGKKAPEKSQLLV